MIGWFTPGQEVRDVLWHASGTAGVTGWTVTVFKDGVLVSDLGQVITDLGSGFYGLTFTPSEEGLWVIDIYETAAATVHYPFSYVVKDIVATLGGAAFDSNSHSLAAIRTAIQAIRDKQFRQLATSPMNPLSSINLPNVKR